LAVFKYIVYGLVYAVTLGKCVFWLFPNLTEDVGFFESFVPVYQFGNDNNNKNNAKSKSSSKKNTNSTNSTKTEEKSAETETETTSSIETTTESTQKEQENVITNTNNNVANNSEATKRVMSGSALLKESTFELSKSTVEISKMTDGSVVMARSVMPGTGTGTGTGAGFEGGEEEFEILDNEEMKEGQQQDEQHATTD